METKTTTGITFQVEELSPPQRKLLTRPYLDILKNRIESDLAGGFPELGMHNITPDFLHGIIAYDRSDLKLVEYGYHTFFSSLFQAYAEHRPYIFSPDMIWLLISQGFSQHVNNNSEKLRHHFVNFSGKLTLINQDNRLNINNPDAPWEEMFPGFIEKLRKEIGADLINALEADFSTTTLVDKIASQITIMDSVKSYFQFIQFVAICGIPEITLEGTTSDWKRIIEKVQKLRQYDLDWWVEKLEPILQEFVNASENKINKEFWQNIFKIKKIGGCGEYTEVNGWITNFFPYDSDGKRISGTISTMINSPQKLPKEISKTDVELVMIGIDGSQEVIPLEIWAGFVGAAQNPETLALRPQTGWLIRKKEGEKSFIRAELEKEKDSSFLAMELIEIPEELYSINKYKSLTIYFKEGIKIPERMGKIQFDYLNLNGEIDEAGIIRILKIFPNTRININTIEYDVMIRLRFPLLASIRYKIGQRRDKKAKESSESDLFY